MLIIGNGSWRVDIYHYASDIGNWVCAQWIHAEASSDKWNRRGGFLQSPTRALHLIHELLVSHLFLLFLFSFHVYKHVRKQLAITQFLSTNCMTTDFHSPKFLHIILLFNYLFVYSKLLLSSNFPLISTALLFQYLLLTDNFRSPSNYNSMFKGWVSI